MRAFSEIQRKGESYSEYKSSAQYLVSYLQAKQARMDICVHRIVGGVC